MSETNTVSPLRQRVIEDYGCAQAQPEHTAWPHLGLQAVRRLAQTLARHLGCASSMQLIGHLVERGLDASLVLFARGRIAAATQPVNCFLYYHSRGARRDHPAELSSIMFV
jgi:hypothetical protein